MEESTELAPIEALIEEYSAKLRMGVAPTVETFAREHPEQADELSDLLPSIVAMEEIREHRDQVLVDSNVPMPARIGDFEITREIGRGGMGIVYEAHERGLNRRVALKVLPEHCLMNPVRLERFKREAQAAAKLHHTNIVPVYGVGESNGLHHYAMQFIAGRSLHQIIVNSASTKTGNILSASALPARKAKHWQWGTRIILQVAEALQYAHSQGVLHRDIKPANILVDSKDIAWVADFGLAKVAEDDALTAQGDLIGTIQYMAPESLLGSFDERGDIYSLGMTLYEMLTCRPPYSKTTVAALINEIMTHDPLAPRKIDPNIPQDLETITLKATARTAEKRYQSAAEFADDLRSFLEDRPIRARKATATERMVRWCRRNRGIAALSGVAALAILAALVVGWVGYAQTHAALKRECLAVVTARESEARAQANVTMSLDALEKMFEELKNSEIPPDFRQPWQPGLAEQRPPETGLPSSPPDDRYGPKEFQRGGDESRPHHERLFHPESLLTTPGSRSTALLGVVKSILEFYERFAEKSSTNPQLQMESARAYERVGELYLRLDQTEKARQAFTRANETINKLKGLLADSMELALIAVKTHAQLGALEDKEKHFDESAGEFKEAISILSALPPSVVRWRGDWATLRLSLARSLTQTGRFDEAIRVLQDAVKFHEPDADSSENARETTRTAYLKLAELYTLIADHESSTSAVKKAGQFAGSVKPTEPR